MESASNPSIRSLCDETIFNGELTLTSTATGNAQLRLNESTELSEAPKVSLVDFESLKEKIKSLEYTVTVLKESNNELRELYNNQQKEQSRINNQLFELLNTVSNLKKIYTEHTNDQNNNITSNDKNEKTENHNDTPSLIDQIINLNSDVSKINAKLETFTTHITSVSTTLYRLDSDVQKFVKKHSLIIENLCPKEDISALEMLSVFINSVLNVTITDSDIENLHIIDKGPFETSPTSNSKDKNKQMKPRPLLVTFTCYKTQASIYKSWLSFRSKILSGCLSSERGQGINIKEYLTEQQEEVYNQAFKLKEEHLVADCWTYKGKSYIKKLNGVVSEFCNRNEVVPKTENSNCLVM